MHWVEVEARKLLELGSEHTIATGISPSGPIHVGNMREILTGDLLRRGVLDRGGSAKLLYIADSFDPLRKVYPFLDESWKQHTGKPLSVLPSPSGTHDSYAEEFLEPFLGVVKELGVVWETLRADKMYAEGRYADTIRIAIREREPMAKVLGEVSKRDMPVGWWPYQPLCSECQRFVKDPPTGFDDPVVTYSCRCGHQGESRIDKAEGKLYWRVDWPARWVHLGITCEPFGKDHASPTGSYATGKAVIEGFFDRPAPHPVTYEWIQLKGKGSMSSSKGIAVTAQDLLEITPREVFRFLISWYNKDKGIDFEPVKFLPNFVDEYDRVERWAVGAEPPPDRKAKDSIYAYQLAHLGPIPTTLPEQVNYQHLAILVQIAGTEERIPAILKDRFGLDRVPDPLLDRAVAVHYWVAKYAPPEVRFTLQRGLMHFRNPPGGLGFLKRLHEKLSTCEWEAQAIHDAIYATEIGDLPKKDMFRLIYNLFLDQDRGPRLGAFLKEMERDFVLKRVALEE